MSGAEGDAGANADADSGGRPLDELGELVPEKDKGCGLNFLCWAGKGLNELGDLAKGAWDTVWFLSEQLDGIVIGLAKGLGGLVAELFVIARGIVKLAGIYDLVDWVGPGDGAFDEFKNTWAGLWDGVKTVFTTNPLTTLKGIVMAVWEPMRDSWKRGDYGEAIGRGAFDALVAVFGAKGLGKASKVKGAKDGTPAAGVTDEAARAAAEARAARPPWLQRMLDGQEFNRARAPAFPYNELYVRGPEGQLYRLDSYNPYVNAGEIVSRKNTQLAAVQPRTALQELAEIDKKYPPQTPIADVPSTPRELVGKRLQGQKILEVPVQDSAVPKAVLEEATRRGIAIRDVTGRVYNLDALAGQGAYVGPGN